MAKSKDVLTVVGMLCLNRTFRDEFFANPDTHCASLVGAVADRDRAQINAMAGKGVLPAGLNRDEYVKRLKGALDQVHKAMTCPMPPCPDDDDPDNPPATAT